MSSWRKYTTDAAEGAISFYNEALDVLVEVGMNGAILKISKPVAATTLFEVLANGDVNADGTIAGAGSGSNIVKTDVDDQFSGLTQKASPVAGDFLILESAADGGAKRKVPWSSLPSAGGVTDFTDLGDVDGSYTGDGLKFVRVKASEDGLEFANVSPEISPALSFISGHPESTDFIPIWDASASVLKKLGYWDIEVQQVHGYVYNNSGATITKGTPVYITGINGTTPTIAPADSDNGSTMSAVGIAEADISNSTNGWVAITGNIQGLDTSGWSVNDDLYVDSGGGLTDSPPADNIQRVAVVTKVDASTGRIEVLVGSAKTQAGVKALYEANTDTNAFTDAEKTKLSNIEANADVTDTDNVTAAGALMDSEVTNLAAVKAFDPADYATAAQGSTADSALQPGGVTASDIDSESSTDGYVLTSDGAGGTAWEAVPGGGGGDAWGDAVDADIVPDADGTRDLGSSANRFAELHVDQIDLNGTTINSLEDGADVTDATNVAAAGALMTADAGALATLDTVDTAQIDTDAIQAAQIRNGAVEFAKIAPAAVVTEADTIAANDNDTTLPTSAAVKDYADKAVVAASGVVDQIDFESVEPGDDTITLRLYAHYAFTINELRIKTASGTCTVAVKIDGTDVTGISAVAVSSTEATGTATAANSVSVGQTVTLVISSSSSVANLVGSLKFTR